MGVDEYRLMGWALFTDRHLATFRLDEGKLLQRIVPKDLYSGAPLATWSNPDRGDHLALGFQDGTVQIGRIGFQSRLLDPEEITPAILALCKDQSLPFTAKGEEFGTGMVQRSAEGVYRFLSLRLELEPAIKDRLPAPLLHLDMSVSPSGSRFLAALSANGTLTTSSVSTEENLITGEKKTVLTGGELQLPDVKDHGPPRWLSAVGTGDAVLLVWENGHAVRISTQPVERPRLMEELEFLEPGSEAKVTAVQLLLGRGTLLVGDSTGRVRAWFRAPDPRDKNPDHHTLVCAHTFPGSGSPVTSLATSTLSRSVAVGHADGQVNLFFVTSEKHVAEVWTAHGESVQSLLIAPKDNALFAFAANRLWSWNVQMRHPEITLRSLIRPIWYEGYPIPSHVWQTSGGDGTEAKFGMWPLVFGTLKATFYSLLLGVPLALLAAVYTSEFMHRRTRAVVKPAVEMMASLPSVILGFLAATVVAPFVNRLLPCILASFLTFPGAFLLCAYLWQLLPQWLTLRLERWRLLFLVLALPLGAVSSIWVGQLVESLLFGGDVRAWLNNPVHHGGTPGWFLLLLPVAGLLTLLLTAQFVNAPLRAATRTLSPFLTALVDLAKFVAICVAACLLSFVMASLLAVVGLDPRDSFVGGYDQQNALVVGFMMGFAIIPIVYTISEDALSLVPEHLRSASLGCGATRWQTAWRVIIPTAMSGLFSAVMIGLGRAVGETMIVLMGVGGTAILDWNMFNGFRTLSATIASQMPEAARDSTEYRTLFLAALTLFVITFFLNTVAELVRIRFRKRVYQL
jgi:phosphate transport system permease protein